MYGLYMGTGVRTCERVRLWVYMLGGIPTSYWGCPAQMSSSSRVRRSPIPWPGLLTVVSRKVSHSSVKMRQ